MDGQENLYIGPVTTGFVHPFNLLHFVDKCLEGIKRDLLIKTTYLPGPFLSCNYGNVKSSCNIWQHFIAKVHLITCSPNTHNVTHAQNNHPYQCIYTYKMWHVRLILFADFLLFINPFQPK